MPLRHYLLALDRIPILISLVLLISPAPALAHAGHGHEFTSQPVGTAHAIQLDADTSRRLGVRVESVTRQRLALGLNTTGQIEALPNQSVDVTTPVGGTVVRLLVNPGDRVRAGQAVAIMTSPDLANLRTQALDRRTEAIGAMQQAQADLQLAQQTYQQQRAIVAASIRQAEAEVKVAQERYDKDRELLQQGAIPRRTVLESEAQLAEARAAMTKAASALELSAAQAQLQRAESAVQVAQSQISLSGDTYETRLRQLGTTPNPDGTLTIAAPISGVIADRDTTVGESGQDAGKKILTIVNDRQVQVSANIYEKDVGRVQIGQRMQVNAKGLNRFLTGRVTVIGATVEGVSRVIPVKSVLDNANGLLKPGMFVELAIFTDRTPTAVIAIPRSAVITTQDGQSIVFVQNGQAFEPIPVTLGRESDQVVEVKEGLFEGDRIVTQRANQLYAQSLRGGTTPPTDSPQPPPSAPPVSWLPMLNAPLLPWLLLPLGGGLAAGTFWAGMVWAKRRDRRSTHRGDRSSASSEGLGYPDPEASQGTPIRPETSSNPAPLPPQSSP